MTEKDPILLNRNPVPLDSGCSEAETETAHESGRTPGERYGISQLLTRAGRIKAQFTGENSDSDCPAETRRAVVGWFLAGLLVLLIGLTILELRQPFYFTQSDNYCHLLPLTVQACRSAFAGEFPEWNPYQLLGLPTARLGVVTYPVTHLCYAAARFLLRNEYVTLELWAAFHLLLGYASMFWAARAWKAAPSAAFCASVCFALSGYSLVIGRSWGLYIVDLAFIPFMFGFLALLRDGKATWRLATLVGIGLGLEYHGGFQQMWVYGILLFCLALAVMFACGEIPLKRILLAAGMLIVGLGVAAPLIYVFITFAGSLNRGREGVGITWDNWTSMLLPWPLVKSGRLSPDMDDGTYYLGTFYYSGTLLTIVCALLAVCMCLTLRPRRTFGRNPMVVCAVIALLLCFGDRGYVWRMFAHLPLLHNFRYPERAFGVYNLAMLLAGAVGLSRLMSGSSGNRRIMGALSVTSCAAMLYLCHLPPDALTIFKGRPFPTIPADLRSELTSPDPDRPQRVATAMPMDYVPFLSFEPDYPLGLEQNFASVYELYAFHGYSPMWWWHPLVEQKVKDRIGRHRSVYLGWVNAAKAEAVGREELCRAYGIRKVILYREFVPGLKSVYPDFEKHFQSASVRTVEGVAPMAFPAGHPETALPVKFSSKGVRVDVSAGPGTGEHVINILAWPDFRVLADGTSLSYSSDEWGRMRVQIPPGTKVIDALYTPPWGTGLLIGIVLLCLGGIVLLIGTCIDAAPTRRNSPCSPQIAELVAGRAVTEGELRNLGPM